MSTKPATQLTRIVGQESGDHRGNDDRVLQAGIDALAGLGGGTLKILPGEYMLRKALDLRSGVHLKGGGEDTILKKSDGVTVKLTEDSERWRNSVLVEDARVFTEGCGVLVRGRVGATMAGLIWTRGVVTAIEDNTLILEEPLGEDFMMEKAPTAATIFPLLYADGVYDVKIEGLTLDGNLAGNPEEVNGSVSACVLLQNSHRVVFHGVTAQRYRGDGFSFQTCDDLEFNECASLDHAGFGFHPGSGAQRTKFWRCTAIGNTEGIYFCWGVRDSFADRCVLSRNRNYGASLGHRDTGNRIERSVIEDNGKIGVLFREEANASRSAHSNVLAGNTFTNNGIGVELRGETHDIEISGNHFEDTGGGRQRIGIRISPASLRTTLEDNEFTGTATEIDRSVTIRKRVKELLGK